MLHRVNQSSVIHFTVRKVVAVKVIYLNINRCQIVTKIIRKDNIVLKFVLTKRRSTSSLGQSGKPFGNSYSSLIIL